MCQRENPRSVERPQGCFHLEWKLLQKEKKSGVAQVEMPYQEIPRKAETQSDLRVLYMRRHLSQITIYTEE